MNRHFHLLFLTVLPWLLSVSTAVLANDAEVDALLNAAESPEGVVFEIIESDGSDLEWSLAQISGYSRRLKERFPDLDIAVVTHGGEQFGLLSSEREALPTVHELARSLNADGTEVHVCAVHASWRDNEPEDFPDYVDVADSGPAQINRYRDLGYEVIMVEESHRPQ